MAAFSFYGDSRSESHETRRYFQVAATNDYIDDDDDHDDSVADPRV